MKSNRKRFAAAIGLCLVAHLATHRASAQSTGTDDEIRQKYRQAAALMADKKSAEAKKLFLELWSQSKSYDIAAALGQLAFVAKSYVEAAQYLSFATTKYPPHGGEKQLQAFKKWFTESKKHVASYELVTNVTGAMVSVDGVDIGQAPLDTPIFLEPGLHLLGVTHDGYKHAQRKLNSVVGTAEKLEISLEPEEKPIPPVATNTAAPPTTAPAPTVAQPFQEPPREPAKPNPWILVGGGVITVGGLVTGLVFDSKANSEYDKAQTLKNEFGLYGCSSGAATGCSALMDHRKNHDRDRNISTAGFVVGGAALVGTALYWLWPRTKLPSSAGQMKLQAVASPRTSWLGVEGNF